MSQLSGLNKVFVTGVNSERTRLKTALHTHLQGFHGFNDSAVHLVEVAVGLNTLEVTTLAEEYCAVCGAHYSSKPIVEPMHLVYGQAFHAPCVKKMTHLIEMFTEENK